MARLNTGDYQVIRVAKIKTTAGLFGRLAHATRHKSPRHADPDRAHLNEHWLGEITASTGMTTNMRNWDPARRTAAALARFRSILPEKVRKNAVLAIEIIITGSGQTLTNMGKKDVDKYLRDSLSWVVKRFGGEANLVAYSVHRDESTPHLSVFLVPKVDGRLRGHALVGGPRELAQLQTDFHQGVAQHHGLKRGRLFSPARHMDVRTYHSLADELAQGFRAEQEAAKTQWRDDKHRLRH